jgi:hypothetical protein
MIHAGKLDSTFPPSNKIISASAGIPAQKCGEMTPCKPVPDGEVCGMNPEQQLVTNTGGPASPVHLLITAGGIDLRGADHERMVQAITLRATQVGPVLEEILLESESQPEWGWGLNE